MKRACEMRDKSTMESLVSRLKPERAKRKGSTARKSRQGETYCQPDAPALHSRPPDPGEFGQGLKARLCVS